MRTCIIVGTRPEIIKMSPIIREYEKRKLDFFILHTGQHYTNEMDQVFFDNLNLEEPKYNLNVGSGSQGEQFANIVKNAEVVLLNEGPDLVLVQGDTNSVFASALIASRQKIKVGHVEAGLRSFDRNMPEEINRILTDQISDLLFCPTPEAMQNAIKDNINKRKLFVTGNTIVDAVIQNKELARERSTIMRMLDLENKGYFLVTIHRQENTDHKINLLNIITALDKIKNKYNLPIIYPIHPRTRKMLTHFRINIPESIKLINALDFFNFLVLESNARLILTDSGGIQEESCILKVPCATLRDSTERPETIDVGSNILTGNEPKKILSSVDIMLNKKNTWKNPYGDGKSGEKIVTIIQKMFHKL